MKAVKVEVLASGPQVMAVHLNDQKLSFDGDGKATVEVPEKGFHMIRWHVMGKEGETYSVAITKPEFVGFSHSNKLDKDGQDAGHQWFSVEE